MLASGVRSGPTKLSVTVSTRSPPTTKGVEEMATRGHSNARVDELTAHPTATHKALIAIEGGANVYSVKELPPLALSRDEWKAIGDRMNWWQSPPDTNGGCLWVEFHDRGGRLEVDALSDTGIEEAKFQCARMIEELEEAQEKLNA